MNTLKLSSKAREYNAVTSQLEAATSENGNTLAKYLCFLAQRYPLQVDFIDIGEELGLSPSQVSRTTRALHVLAHSGAPGLNLIDVSFDPADPRTKLVVLNQKGLDVLGRIFLKE